jgi:sulfite reductase beta subunit-like hemoprotein
MGTCAINASRTAQSFSAFSHTRNTWTIGKCSHTRSTRTNGTSSTFGVAIGGGVNVKHNYGPATSAATTIKICALTAFSAFATIKTFTLAAFIAFDVATSVRNAIFGAFSAFGVATSIRNALNAIRTGQSFGACADAVADANIFASTASTRIT